MRTKAYMIAGVALALLIVAAPAAAQKQYLILTPSAWTETLEPLVRLREAGKYSVTVQTTDYLQSVSTPLPAEVIHELIKRRRPAVCLLVGDVPKNMPEKLKPFAIPTRIIAGKVYGGSRTVASDSAYGVFRNETDEPTDEASHIPTVQIGRLSVQSKAELKAVVAKIVAAEKPSDHGPWRKRINLFGATPSFGKRIDSLLDGQITYLVDATIPSRFDVSMTYGRSNSPYCWPASKFADKVVERFNEGCLIFAFMGHAYSTRVSSVYDSISGKSFPVLDRHVAKRFAARENTATICLLLTGDAGKFDLSKDCLAESIFKQPRGPVAVIASTRFSWPYGHALFGKELMEALCDPGTPTIGRALKTAYRDILSKPGPHDGLRMLIERTAESLKKGLATPSERIMHVYLYNLLGDPATPIPRPPMNLSVTAAGIVEPGATLQVTTSTLDALPVTGTVEITVELPRTVNPFPTPKPSTQPAARDVAMETRYRNAHNKILTRVKLPYRDGMTVAVPLPGESPMFGCTLTYLVKVHLRGRYTTTGGPVSAFAATTIINPD